MEEVDEGEVLNEKRFAQTKEPIYRPGDVSNRKRPIWEYLVFILLIVMSLDRGTIASMFINRTGNQHPPQTSIPDGSSNQDDKKPSIFIMIHTRMYDIDARSSIRALRMNETCESVDIEVKFMVCMPGHVGVKIKREVIFEKDVVWLNCNGETRWNGVYTVEMIKWAYHYRLDSDWIIKMDMNTYPYLPNLVHRLKGDPSQKVLIGERREVKDEPRFKTGIGPSLYGMSQGLLAAIGDECDKYFMQFFPSVWHLDQLKVDENSMMVIINQVEHLDQTSKPGNDWTYSAEMDSQMRQDCHHSQTCEGDTKLIKPKNFQNSIC